MSTDQDDGATPAEQPVPPPADPNAPPRLRVLAQFTKDLSFENPGVLSAQQGQGSPEIELGIDVRVEPGPAAEAVFGVDLKLSAKAKREDKVVFIAELVYTGVFQLQGLNGRDAEPLLLIECPRLLFPFARRIIAEVTRDGGHPPLLIDPIDFVGLYQKQKAGKAAPGADAQPAQDGDEA